MFIIIIIIVLSLVIIVLRIVSAQGIFIVRGRRHYICAGNGIIRMQTTQRT